MVTHTPLQFVSPAGQVAVQAPFTQTWPAGHALLQLPQFSALLIVSTQVRAHWVYPVGHPLDVH